MLYFLFVFFCFEIVVVVVQICLPFFAHILSVAEIAQLEERQTEGLKVPGSNPESSYEL